MLKILSAWVLGVLFCFSPVSYATPVRPTGGAINVKIAVSPNVEAALKAGTLPVKQAVPMTVSFFYPNLGNAAGQARAWIIFDPLDSTVSAPGLKALQLDPTDSSYEDPVAYEIDLSAKTPETTISAPFNWTPVGKHGASARVKVIVKSPAGDMSGTAAYTVGVQENQTIKPMNSTEIYRRQLDAMKQDVQKAARDLVSRDGDSAPFIPANHAKALERDSDEFEPQND